MVSALPKAPHERSIVVVVDDDLAVLTSLKFALEQEGYAVRTYSDASSLLHDSSAACNALLVIDYRLPDKNGFDLLEQLRAKGVQSPAILITSTLTESVRRRADALQIPILEKPLLDNSLIEAIHKQRGFMGKAEHF